MGLGKENIACIGTGYPQANLTEIISLPDDETGHIYNQFVARFPNRDKLQAFLKEKAIETEVYYPLPLHHQECFRELGYRPGNFPNAEAASRDSLALPVYPELTEEQRQYIVAQ